MSAEAWITLAVLLITFAALASGRVATSVGMGGAVGVLLLGGVLSREQALSGLSSSAPVTIAALYVLAGAATLTGALSPVVDSVLDGRGGRGGERARLARLASSSMAMSAVLPNTRWSRWWPHVRFSGLDEPQCLRPRTRCPCRSPPSRVA